MRIVGPSAKGFGRTSERQVNERGITEASEGRCGPSLLIGQPGSLNQAEVLLTLWVAVRGRASAFTFL